MLEKNLSYGFEIIDIFCKNAVLNICGYLKRFFMYKKINSIFLKFDHSLLRVPKSWVSVLNICGYLKRFFMYKKINSIFLKFDHSLLRVPKSWVSVKSFLPKNAIQKDNQTRT